MLGKLIEIVLGAKSGALSGVLIVAGAVVTVSSGNGVTTVTIEHPSPTPAIEAPAGSPALEDEDEDIEQEEGEDADTDEDKDENGTRMPDPSCADEAQARNEARQKVHDAYVRFHTAIAQLHNERKTDRALETLKKADDLIREIAEKADRVLNEMGHCREKNKDEEKPEVEEVGTSSVEDSDALTMQQVAERAVAAMETVYNLAKGAAEATPSPKPTVKPTERSKATEKPRSTAKPTPKPSKTPSCESRLYENKLKMAAAFEKYHTLNDKIYAIKYTLPETVRRTVIASDELMHRTYDKAKSEILSSGCAGDLGAAAAARAAVTFEQAYYDSARAVATTGR